LFTSEVSASEDDVEPLSSVADNSRRVAPKLTQLRVALPPSYAKVDAEQRLRLEQFLSFATSLHVEAKAAASYDALAKCLLGGEAHVAWAPPFTCARLENAGIPVLVRAVRKGAATYRAALMCQAATPVHLDKLRGLRAAWVDRESTGGYLLAAGFLKGRGVDLDKTFSSQIFVGSYQAALNALVTGQADVSSVYAPPSEVGSALELEDVLPGKANHLKAIAFTDEAPNDGVALAPFTPPVLVRAIEQAFIGASELPMGPDVLKLFHAESFEVAPKNGYRALYLALRSLR
jgi:phosphonate transport system substrate-binding protein